MAQFQLIVDDNIEKVMKAKFEEQNEAEYWYDRCARLDADSMALWEDSKLIKFVLKENE